MGILKNWLICGDVDGVDHKERTEFRKNWYEMPQCPR